LDISGSLILFAVPIILLCFKKLEDNFEHPRPFRLKKRCGSDWSGPWSLYVIRLPTNTEEPRVGCTNQ